jgi:hypothetical protein
VFLNHFHLKNPHFLIKTPLFFILKTQIRAGPRACCAGPAHGRLFPKTALGPARIVRFFGFYRAIWPILRRFLGVLGSVWLGNARIYLKIAQNGRFSHDFTSNPPKMADFHMFFLPKSHQNLIFPIKNP